MDDEDCEVPFHAMGLDDRVLQSIANLGWSNPTLIQEKAIPLALEGKDILIQAKTGSGKTAAFAIPIIQKILLSKQSAVEQSVRAIVVTPSKQLCVQACKVIKELSYCCTTEIQCVDISPKEPLPVQKPILMEKPDIVVGTPSRILAHIGANNLFLKDSMEFLVIDEADLLLAFGYINDMKALLKHFPKIYQSLWVTATLNTDINTLKKMILHNAVVLKLEEPQIPEHLMQYHIMVEDDDKYALMCALFKLKLIRGRSLMFVNTIDESYRLKMFLQQFGIKSCILNNEMPLTSRCNIVDEFNRAVYDNIIATDEQIFEDDAEDTKKKTKKENDGCGVSRGVDFYNVSNVINFDFPESVNAYIHRIGRTARAKQKGTALSFVNSKEREIFDEVEEVIIQESGDSGSNFKPFNFNMKRIEGFQYRSKDALNVCTRKAVKEARLKEIRQEVLNSKKLNSFFQAHPRDKEVLHHDAKLQFSQKSLKLENVPDYLIPTTLKDSIHNSPSVKKIQPFSHQRTSKKKKRKYQADPLKNFTLSSSKKKRYKK
ncbi:probable ATP-dependent RNA helicase DDX56 [Octopus sinensis]|uniref:RNA helicase n=1 Tax=Octopus sinensis TaxID=2607531 RepID=A0A6P7U669_9MOLL|nr:probable ATP-dependent RNA helicase DDX56 [Octopus sinensis]